MSLCLLSYLGGMLDCVSAISCGSDIVTCPGTGQIITPLLHDIAKMLTSPHLNRNLSYLSLSLSSFLLSSLPSLLLFLLFISTLGNAVYSCLLRLFLLCPSWERRAPLLVCFCLFSRHNNSGSCGVIRLIFFGWRMAR
jgi:hypothetical protein